MNGLHYVRPGHGFVPNFPLFKKRDVNGEKEDEIYTFFKVSSIFCSSFLLAVIFFFNRKSKIRMGSTTSQIVPIVRRSCYKAENFLLSLHKLSRSPSIKSIVAKETE